MRILYLIIVLLHGLIHLLGFVKGFGFKDVKELTIPISKPIGLLWLTAAVLLLVYLLCFYTNARYAWLIGMMAGIISQILIIAFWKDAKFGTLPNLAILIVSLIAYGQFNFQKMVQLETDRILAPITISGENILREQDIKDLPSAVKRWLRHSGAIGKPMIRVGKVLQQAEMKLRPEQDKWHQATAVQYTTCDIPAFIWSVDVKMNSLIGFQGRDKFENGKGEMLIKLNALIKVVDEGGEKINEGTLQRYLGELVWFPSLALSPYITWEEINDSTALARMVYEGTEGSGIFHFNPEGAFTKFSTMRFNGNDPDSKRYEWVLLVEDYSTFEGITVPSKMTATWKLENMDWTWLKLEIKEIKYNEQVFLTD